jgi:hypothetical protein
MTPQPASSVAEQIGTVPPAARHQHDSACYWDVDDCRWQCLGRPLRRYGHPSANGRPATDTETRP